MSRNRRKNSRQKCQEGADQEKHLEATNLFTWLNKQGVQSDSGFIVQFTGRFTAEYREGGKTMTVDVEIDFSAGKPCVIIGPDAFQSWDSANSRLSDSQRERLFRNFREACEFQGLKLVVEKGE
jgi:hypothetical protein